MRIMLTVGLFLSGIVAADIPKRHCRSQRAAVPAYRIEFQQSYVRPHLVWPGSGVYGSSPTRRLMELYKIVLEAGLATSMAEKKLGPDGVRYLSHYLSNTGSDLEVDMARLIADCSIVASNYHRAQAEAKRFVQTLPVGEHNFVAVKVTAIEITGKDSRNWHFALGAVYGWGKGSVTISERSPGLRQYDMRFSYVILDYYDWPDVDTSIFGRDHLLRRVTDRWMGEFHRQKLAHDYRANGQSALKRLLWND